MPDDVVDELDPLAVDPSAVAPDPAISSEAPGQDAAPATDTAGTASADAAGQAPEPPVFDPEAWKNNPTFRSYLNKEQAAEQQRTEARIRAQAEQQAAIAERQRLEQERMALLEKAYNGDLEAQQQLATDAYTQALTNQQKNAAILEMALSADRSVMKLTGGDPADTARLDFRRFQTMEDWQEACTTYAVEKAQKSQSVQERIQAEAEAIAASRLAQIRGVQPNPDTAEIVGGAGQGLALKSQQDWDNRYVALLETDPDAARALRMRMHTPEYRSLPRSA